MCQILRRLLEIHENEFGFHEVSFELQEDFGILDCGLRPGGAIGAYAPEGFRIGGIATLYQLQWTEFLKSKIQIQKSKIALNLQRNKNGLKKPF
jgi:hypothetical protein